MHKRRTESIAAFVLTTAVIYLSLILPAYCLTSAKNFIMQKNELEDGKSGVAYTASFAAPAMGEDKLREIEPRFDGTLRYISARVDDVIVCEGAVYPVVVTAKQTIANEAQEIDTDIDVNSGEENQCVISDSLAQSAGIHPGDLILVHGQEHTVVDTFHSASRGNVIKIPFEEMPLLYPDYYIQQTVGGEKETTAEFISEASTVFPDLRVIEMSNSAVAADETENFLVDMILTRCMVGVAAVLIGILNTVIILISEMHTHIFRYGVRRAYGACFTDILKMIMQDYIPAGTAAVIALFITFPKIMDAAGLGDEIRFDTGGCVAISLFFCAFMVVLASAITWRINKACIADLLEERV